MKLRKGEGKTGPFSLINIVISHHKPLEEVPGLEVKYGLLGPILLPFFQVRIFYGLEF